MENLTKTQRLYLELRAQGKTAHEIAAEHGIKYRSVLRTIRLAEQVTGRKLYERPRTDCLSKKNAAIIHMVEEEDLSAAEIARRLGVCNQTVNNHLKRIEKVLGRPLRRTFGRTAKWTDERVRCRIESRLNMSGERCKCGLLAPCDSCIPDATAFARSGTTNLAGA